MHSIQEEDEDLEQYSRHMRTGSSIDEDDHNSEEEFNMREPTGYISKNDRDDIDDMEIAGTKTQLKYQKEDEKVSDNNLNEDIKDVAPDSFNAWKEDKFEEIHEESNLLSETIPIGTQNDATQFSIHDSKTQFSVHSPDNEAEWTENLDEIRVPSQTTFSVHKVVDNPEDQNDENATKFSVKTPEEDIPDETPKTEERSINELVINLGQNKVEEEDLEEGTFEDYELGQDELPSRTKVFGKAILQPNAENQDIEKERQKLDFDPKPELTGTEKYFESPFKNPSSAIVNSNTELEPENSRSLIEPDSLNNIDPEKEETEEKKEIKDSETNYEKYSIKSKNILPVIKK